MGVESRVPMQTIAFGSFDVEFDKADLFQFWLGYDLIDGCDREFQLFRGRP